MSESDYSVYLVQHHGEQGGKREVTSPVRGHGLDFYETGVWLDRGTGRNFFPYEQIRTIREHPEGEVAEGEVAESEVAESEGTTPEASDDQGSSPPEGGDSGAEEEMLEE